jgi:hypothetical protein
MIVKAGFFKSCRTAKRRSFMELLIVDFWALSLFRHSSFVLRHFFHSAESATIGSTLVARRAGMRRRRERAERR